MLPLYSALSLQTVVEFNDKSSRIVSKVITSKETANGLRYFAHAVEDKITIEGFGVGASTCEACKLATIECADRWVTRFLPVTYHPFLVNLRLYDRSIGIASSEDRLVALKKAQNDLTDKIELAKFQREINRYQYGHNSKESFNNGIYTVTLCEDGVFGAGSSSIRQTAVQHAEDEIFLQKVLRITDDPLPFTLYSKALELLPASQVTKVYYLDKTKRFLVML